MNEIINQTNNNINDFTPTNYHYNRKETNLLKYIEYQIENSKYINTRKYNTYYHIECKPDNEIITREEIIRYICSRQDTVDGREGTDNPSRRSDYDSVVIFRNARLKNTIRQLKAEGAKIKITGNKEILIQRLIQHFNVHDICTKNRQHLCSFKNKMISYLKNKPKYTWDKYTKVYNNRELCVNDEDPIGCYELKEIDKEYFYVIKEGKYYYGYDIRTILSIIYHSGWNKSKNPLTRNLFDKSIYIDCSEKILRFKNKGLSLFYEEEASNKSPSDTTPREKLISIINKLSYELYQLDFHVTEEQLRRINIRQYRNIYATFSNIWFFNITNEIRNIYNNDTNNPLNIPTYADFNNTITNTDNFGHIIMQLVNILNIFYKLITNPINIEDKKTGAMYVMISLCSINSSIRDEYPQFVNVLQEQ
jgi:hypothetical protein